MYHLKINGIECEYASEYAKDLVFDYPGDISVFKNQIEIYQEQRKRIFRYLNKVQVIVTDSPLPLFLYYEKSNNEEFHKKIMDEFNECNNLNFYLIRNHPYNSNGRYQDENGANETHNSVKNILNNNSIFHYEVITGDKCLEYINEKIIANLKI